MLGSVGTIQISTASLQAKATDSIEFVANLDARESVPASATFDPTDSNSYNHSYTTPVFDSLGNPHTVSQYFVKTANTNEWNLYVYVDGVQADLDGSGTADASDVETVVFGNDGTLDLGAASNTLTVDGNYNIPVTLAPVASNLDINVNLASITQYGSDFVVSKNSLMAIPPVTMPAFEWKTMARSTRPIPMASHNFRVRLCLLTSPLLRI
ncbi:flagellar hook protein FlgE [Vibrio variabilis]|uniref:Flagellar hook protein FlgE n=1 Tax=Vibrio variabilis TaxID=990271 RepID=A0ABQ0JFE3_9VIBR|nr:flagellar hook protein FlgE [Vibrio variabilis]